MDASCVAIACLRTAPVGLGEQSHLPLPGRAPRRGGAAGVADLDCPGIALRSAERRSPVRRGGCLGRDLPAVPHVRCARRQAIDRAGHEHAVRGRVRTAGLRAQLPAQRGMRVVDPQRAGQLIDLQRGHRERAGCVDLRIARSALCRSGWIGRRRACEREARPEGKCHCSHASAVCAATLAAPSRSGHRRCRREP